VATPDAEEYTIAFEPGKPVNPVEIVSTRALLAYTTIDAASITWPGICPGRAKVLLTRGLTKRPCLVTSAVRESTAALVSRVRDNPEAETTLACRVVPSRVALGTRTTSPTTKGGAEVKFRTKLPARIAATALVVLVAAVLISEGISPAT
jgi:hypothetical protein